VQQVMHEASGWLISLAWCPAEPVLVTGSWNGTAQLWDPRTGNLIRWFKLHERGINALAWSPDGRLFASGSADMTVRLANTRGQTVATFGGARSPIHALAWSHDGRRLAFGSGGGSVRIWDVAHKREIIRIDAHHGYVTAVSFSPVDDLLASKGSDGAVRFWDTESWECVASLDERGNNEWRAGLEFRPVGAVLATQADNEPGVRIWDIDTPQLTRSATRPPDEESEWRTRIEQNPRDTMAGRRLIDALKVQGRVEEAAHMLDLLIEADPENEKLVLEKADMYRESGDERRYIETRAFAEELRARQSFEANIGKATTVTEIEIRDLPFFGNFTWKLQPGVNVLLGKNGYGKTHLLRALIAMLQNHKEVTGQFFATRATHGARPVMRLQIDREGESQTSIRSRIVFEQDFGRVPVLAIPDMRYIEKSEDSFGPSAAMKDMRSQGGEAMLLERSLQGAILTFLFELCLDYERNPTFDQPLFRLIQETVQRFTDNTFKFEKIERLHTAQFRILVTTDGNESNPLPLQKVSQGTLSLLAIVGLIYRFLQALHPEAETSSVAKQQGIVVIDEVDAHLHPAWQQQTLQMLRDMFPKVQFIVTAHSPLVVAGCRRHEVSVLRKRSDGFIVEVSPEHFIGATADSLYRKMFDIEEKDLTYLRLSTLQATKTSLEADIESLQNRDTLSAEEEAKLNELEEQVYYLDEVSRIDAHKQRLATYDRNVQRIQMDAKGLLGKLDESRSDATSPGEEIERLQAKVRRLQAEVDAILHSGEALE